MSLSLGSSLGHYDVTALIGEGGMGQVYQATDTQLHRQVALKILPEAFATDPDRLARFQREAQVLASLNHPNIAQIHGIEEAEDTRALVLELVEGPTLADRIAQGPIPLDEALPIAKQIAEALEAAHEAGVIHRDLKPTNIKVREDGTVKVLDFGLAKALDTTPVGDPSQSPTLTAAATQMGVIMGTAAYMSPEQARGKPVDKRTDIWAFGCVLYEMLTGHKVFQGEDVTLTLAEVVKTEPDWVALPSETPDAIRRLLARCLDKDVGERLPHIGEARLDVRDASRESAESPATLETVSGRGQRLRWVTAGAVVGALAATGIGMWYVAQTNSTGLRPQRRLSVNLPEGSAFPSGVETNIAVSADGLTLVFVADVDGVSRLYRRHLDELITVPIPGTAGARWPFLSPDGQWVAFQAEGFSEIRRVPLSGGEPFTICQQCSGGFWGDDGTITFQWDGTLWRIPEVGGSRELLIEPMPDRGVAAMIRPSTLPGGRAVLFEFGVLGSGSVGLASLDTREITVVSTVGTDPFYSPTGHVLFARGNNLFAAPLDVDQLEVTGPTVPVVQGVRVENGGALQAVISRDGVLVYAPAGGALGTQLVWVDRTGNIESVLDEQRRLFFSPRISPDGEQVVVQINDRGNTDLFVYDVASRGVRRLTDDRRATAPLWTYDGSGITYGSRTTDGYAIKSLALDGSSTERTVLESSFPVVPQTWAQDGSSLVFQENLPNYNLFVADVADTGSRTPLVDTEFLEHSATLSRSGQWVAYVSDRSGSEEVYVRPFPEQGVEQVVSLGGGIEPVWGREDQELFYRHPDTYVLMTASLANEPFRVIGRERLFEASSFYSGYGHRHFDIHPDGERFLMINMGDRHAGQATLNVVLNWFEELERLVPVD